MTPDELDALDRVLKDLDDNPAEAEAIAQPVASADPSATRGKYRETIERYRLRDQASRDRRRQADDEALAIYNRRKVARNAEKRKIADAERHRDAYAALIYQAENRDVRQYTDKSGMTPAERKEHERKLDRERKRQKRALAKKAGITQHPLYGRYS